MVTPFEIALLALIAIVPYSFYIVFSNLIDARRRIRLLEEKVESQRPVNAIADAKEWVEQYHNEHPAPHIEARVRRGEFGKKKPKTDAGDCGDNIW